MNFSFFNIFLNFLFRDGSFKEEESPLLPGIDAEVVLKRVMLMSENRAEVCVLFCLIFENFIIFLKKKKFNFNL